VKFDHARANRNGLQAEVLEFQVPIEGEPGGACHFRGPEPGAGTFTAEWCTERPLHPPPVERAQPLAEREAGDYTEGAPDEGPGQQFGRRNATGHGVVFTLTRVVRERLS
jgi:hypothetical protein